MSNTMDFFTAFITHMLDTFKIMLEAAAPLLGVELMLNNPTVEKIREMKLKVMAQKVFLN